MYCRARIKQCTRLYCNTWSQETLWHIIFKALLLSLDKKYCMLACLKLRVRMSTQSLRRLLCGNIFNERAHFGGFSGSEVGRVHTAWLGMKQLELLLLIISFPDLPGGVSWRRAGGEDVKSQAQTGNIYLTFAQPLPTATQHRHLIYINPWWKLTNKIT